MHNDFSGALLGAAISFLIFFLSFRPIEVIFPAKAGQRFFRPDWITDFCFFLGQHLVWIGMVYAIISLFDTWIDGIIPGTFRESVTAQPWWLQVVEIILLSDFLIYWGHRLQHRVDLLWRFHSIHHTSEHLDWLASYREHPLDTLYTMGLINFPAIILGFPLSTIAALIVFRGVWAIYIHTNVRLPIIRPLRFLIGAPELHHWHHNKDRDTGNYANISPLMDLIFGTYMCPDHEPECFGIKEPAAKNYLGHLLQPFKRRA